MLVEETPLNLLYLLILKDQDHVVIPGCCTMLMGVKDLSPLNLFITVSST